MVTRNRRPRRAVLPLCAALAISCSPRTALPTPPDERAEVAALDPGDELPRVDAALRLRFTQPLVPIDAVGPALTQPPVIVQPTLPIRVHWEDRQTLVVRPELEWKRGERYAVQLGPQLKQLVKPPHALTFDVVPLRLSNAGESGDNVSRDPALRLSFNNRVDPEQVLKRCVLQAAGAPPVALRADPDAARTAPPPSIVRVKPATRLAELTRYVVDCPGLTAAGGSAPFRLEADAPPGFTTHGPLKLVDLRPQQGAALPPEEAELCLQLSTPVEISQLAAHVHITPEPEGLAESWYHGSCSDTWSDTDRANSVLLAPRRDYRVTIDAELRDTFGQTLGQARSWSFATSDRVPGLWTNTGSMAVLERGQSGHGVGALNLSSLVLECAQLSPARAAGSFAGIRTWVFESPDTPAEEITQAPWSVLGLEVRSSVLDTSAALNAGRIVPIELGSACGSRRPSAAGASPGLYVSQLAAPGRTSADALQGDRNGRLFVNVTDLALVAKRGDHTGLVWVTRLSTGAPVAGAVVSALDDSGRALAQTRSDALGLARFARLPANGGETFFSVEHADDVALVGSGWAFRDGLSPYQLGVREQFEDASLRLFVHTDRGVYRPGERVLLHGLARRVSDTEPARIPEGQTARLRMQLGPDVKIERALPLSDFGSFSTEIDLPKHVAPGAYDFEVELEDKVQGYSLQIADFRPLTFELTGGPARAELLAPDPIEVAIEGRYLFGAPLPNATLRWTVERAPGAIDPPGFDGFSFSDYAPALPDEEALPMAQTGIVHEQTGSTDAAGRAQLRVPTEAVRGPTRYNLSVEAEDSGHDVAVRRFSVLAHSAERYPGVRMMRGLFSGGEPIEAEVVIVDRDSKQVAGDLELELRESRWDCSDPRQSCKATVRRLERQRLLVSADKPALVRFNARANGDVYVRALAHDPSGRSARASDSAWVWSPEGSGPYNDRLAARLTTDKRGYRPGEQARLALQTPLAPAHYLLTAERSDVLAAKVISTAAGAAAPSLALDERSAPNVFLSMAGMTPRGAAGEAGGPRLVAGAREVKVQGSSRVLDAEIVLQRTRFEPKQRVTGEVRVRHLGKPVRAEVALVAVNESVLQLTAFQTPDPTKTFHAPAGLGVLTTSNIMQVIADPAAATRVPKVARLSDGGEDGNGGRPDLRDDYVAAAYFAPALRTDARGRAQFAFDAPTDLSGYRLMAVVAAQDDRVGSTDARIEVQQPLSAHPLSPRFASEGDALEIGALLHDHTDTPGPIDVHWSAQGLAIAQPTARVSSAAAGATAVYVRAVVQRGQHASFEVQASKGSAVDRVGRSLDVRRPLDRELRVLEQTRAASVKAALAWPKGIDPELSRLEITADRIGLAPLAPVLAAVLDYPYGCTEQTAAALNALAAAPELAAALVPAWRDRTALSEHVADGMSLIAAARAPDGGFGLYPGMPSRGYLTAYVLQALLALRDAGFDVPQGLFEGARAALSRWLLDQKLETLATAELGLATQAAYVLAASGAPDQGSVPRLWTRRASMHAAARAYLLHAMALRSMPADQRAVLRASLREAKWLSGARDPEQPFESPEHTTALVLHALHADGGDPGYARELAELLITRAADPAVYLSTRDIADALAALSAYARSAHGSAHKVEFGLGNKTLFSGTLSGTEVVQIEQSARAAPDGEVWVRADGELSVSIRRRDVSPSSPKPAFSRGLSLVRRYLQPKTGKSLEQFALGDVVQVELELRSEQAIRMLALSDSLPAGLEPLDPALETGRLAGCNDCDTSSSFDHVRRHDDRIEAFAEWLPPGTHHLRYLMRATTAGTFTAPGATAQPMYLPALYARSAVGRIAITR